ncbi:hypothetical protein [Pedobacter rhizosphaerae]|uniref:Uncharacterized protein n=1 Tax=Pedobacter rhizosphaerae TaxID=390241 RepID=A0A1H9S8X9_9SPHI|nr:hypothetical protein [Pedobacter rhizosphaerae]SER81421.1 hypothetical protein SAMN04488023_11725 [Pedobacter rhizosphaerae]
MKNSNKLFEKKIELKNSQISGGLSSDVTYKTETKVYPKNDKGCTSTLSQVLTDKNQLVEECYFSHCP